MRLSAKSDYAIRAVVELAAAQGRGPMTAERLSEIQDIPLKFLHNILAELKRAGIVQSSRVAAGGFVLARYAQLDPLAAIIQVSDGRLDMVGYFRAAELASLG